jgi:FAD/FMN-containing dehydrogenase
MFNWAHSVKLGAKEQVHRLASALEVADLLKSSSNRLKVLGSGMSYLGIGATASNTDILLDLSPLAGLVEVGTDYASFQSSTLLSEVVDELTSRKMQLVCCPGVLMTQTIAGALSTGTHGQGMGNAGIYDAVLELQVVLANGDIKIYTSADTEFDAFRLHLGALGILTRIKFRCEPLKVYKQVKEITTFDDMVRNYEAWNDESEHCKAWWFPETNKVQLWTTYIANKDESSKYLSNNCQITEISEKIESQESNEFSASLVKLVKNMDADTKSSGKTIETSTNPNVPGGRFETVLRFKSQDSRIGNMYQLWCKGIPGIFI